MACAVDLRTWLLLASALAGAGCATAFGIDDPNYDPCAPDACVGAEAGGGTSEGGVDATLNDGATDAPSPDASLPSDGGAQEAEADAPFVEPPGIKCGASGLRCTGATPFCCETLDGGPSYGCVASSAACPGYPIECATATDCTPNDGCCHFQSAMKCEPLSVTNCPAWACDPQLAGSCEAGKSCTVALLNGGQASPYTACTP